VTSTQRQVLATGMMELANVFLGTGILTPIFSGQITWWVGVIGGIGALAVYVTALEVAGGQG
jgi:hypothetical protein